MTRLTYPLVNEPRPPEGGGFPALVADLPACMSDGESPEEAVVNVRDAIDSWIEAANDLSHLVPAPSRHVVLDAAE